MKDQFKMVASCPNKDIYIRDMIAKCFYDTSNKAKYNLATGEVTMWDQIKPDWRVVVKGKRVRLEFKAGV